jgi:hypothetical protein
MTKSKALETLYFLINSTILDIDIEDALQDICNAIEEDKWEEDN